MTIAVIPRNGLNGSITVSKKLVPNNKTRIWMQIGHAKAKNPVKAPEPAIQSIPECEQRSFENNKKKLNNKDTPIR